jgi:hypothetical protein
MIHWSCDIWFIVLKGYSNEYMIPECSEELLYEYFIINSGRLLSDNIYSLYLKITNEI